MHNMQYYIPYGAVDNRPWVDISLRYDTLSLFRPKRL